MTTCKYQEARSDAVLPRFEIVVDMSTHIAEGGYRLMQDVLCESGSGAGPATILAKLWCRIQRNAMKLSKSHLG